MSQQLPPDFPDDLRKSLGLPIEPQQLPGLAPITQKIRDALDESRRTRGKSH